MHFYSWIFLDFVHLLFHFDLTSLGMHVTAFRDMEGLDESRDVTAVRDVEGLDDSRDVTAVRGVESRDVTAVRGVEGQALAQTLV